MTLKTEEQLAIISRAWGDQEGYCFFPTMKGDAKTKQEREFSYQENDPFFWPRDKEQILDHLRDNRKNDVFWCPMLFEAPRRRTEVAMDEYALWADLDEVDPRDIEEKYYPTIAWETSPGRYQALWILRGMLQGASAPGKENHKLTEYLGADTGGWDTTQLLRIPEWPNHKPIRRKENGGKPPKGKLLFNKRVRYFFNVFQELPDVESTSMVQEVVESELEAVNRADLWAEVRLKLKPHMRDFFYAKEARGDRSEVLWQMERDLADLGLNVVQIVKLVQPTVWNKYVGRGDELVRLSSEASKAIAQKGQVPEDKAFTEIEEVTEGLPTTLQRWLSVVPMAKDPDWLIKDLWTMGGAGFIAGQPKSFKSWFALDMAFAIATGGNFLGHYAVKHPGPVIYIQEEDGLPVLKKRQAMMDFIPWKDGQPQPDGTLLLEPKNPQERDPEIYPVVQTHFTISKPGDLVWLDERIAELPDVRAIILDPLIRMLGDVEENRATQMNERIFGPLSILKQKYGCAIIIVHHMKKGDANGQRGGQMMLGSVAFHAWAEDSLYLTRKGRQGIVNVDTESKNAPSTTFKVRVGNIGRQGWTPTIQDVETDEEDDVTVREARKPMPPIIGRLLSAGKTTISIKQYQELANISKSSAHRQIHRALDAGHLVRRNTFWFDISPHHLAAQD